MKAHQWYGLGAVIVTLGCQAAPPEPTGNRPQAGTATVEVVEAARGSLRQPLEWVGRTEAAHQVTIRSRTEGQLVDLRVNIGDPVTVGQVLGRLDDTLLRQALAAAEADLAAAQAEVARVDALLVSAESQVLTATAELTQAQSDAQRLQTLVAEGVVSRQQSEQAQTRVQAAQGSLAAAEAQVKTQLLLRVASENRVIAQQAVVNQAKERLDLTMLRSPLNGVVLTRSGEVGNVFQNNQEILQIGLLDPLQVRMGVSEQVWGQLRQGQTVQVSLDSGPSPGRISRVSPAVDPVTRLFPVEVTLSSPGVGIGQLARITLPSQAPEQIIVPQAAIRDPQNPQVFVVEAGTVRAQAVQVGESRDGRQEIVQGLQGGEAVVVRSSRPLQPGQTVQVSTRS